MNDNCPAPCPVPWTGKSAYVRRTALHKTNAKVQSCFTITFAEQQLTVFHSCLLFCQPSGGYPLSFLP